MNDLRSTLQEAVILAEDVLALTDCAGAPDCTDDREIHQLAHRVLEEAAAHLAAGVGLEAA